MATSSRSSSRTEALFAPELVGADRRAVEAKCLYALQIHAGDRPGPYDDEAAEYYARHALAHHASTYLASRRRRPP